MSARGKAGKLVRMAVKGCDSKDKETETEAYAAAMAACKIIEENDLLDDEERDGIESILNDERVDAVKSIYKKLADPEFISSVKKIAQTFSGRRRRRS